MLLPDTSGMTASDPLSQAELVKKKTCGLQTKKQWVHEFYGREWWHDVPLHAFVASCGDNDKMIDAASEASKKCEHQRHTIRGQR